MAPLRRYFDEIAYKSLNTTSTTGPQTTHSWFVLCSVRTQILLESLSIHGKPVEREISSPIQPHSKSNVRSTDTSCILNTTALLVTPFK